MRSQAISYEAGGLKMEGVYYVDDTKPGKRPAVLVFPEAFGIGAHAKSRAERLAKEFGYAALACDLHGGAKLVQEMADLGPLLGPLRENPLLTRERTNGALKALIAQPEVDASRVGAIGFCFGGTMCLELLRGGADVKGIVGFHSGLYTKRPEDSKNIKGKVLVCIGADDPGITPQERADFEAEMRAGKVDWRMHLYGGVVHSFTNKEADLRNNPAFLKYDAGADARSWKEMADFFKEVFA